jgi:hypothetical protein
MIIDRDGGKRCRWCGQQKRQEEFAVNKKACDGRSQFCLECEESGRIQLNSDGPIDQALRDEREAKVQRPYDALKKVGHGKSWFSI